PKINQQRLRPDQPGHVFLLISHYFVFVPRQPVDTQGLVHPNACEKHSVSRTRCRDRATSCVDLHFTGHISSRPLPHYLSQSRVFDWSSNGVVIRSHEIGLHEPPSLHSVERTASLLQDKPTRSD